MSQVLNDVIMVIVFLVIQVLPEYFILKVKVSNFPLNCIFTLWVIDTIGVFANWEFLELHQVASKGSSLVWEHVVNLA